MGKALKILMVVSIIFSLVVFTVLGVYLKEDMDYNIKELNNKLIIMEKRKEYFAQQTISLQTVKTTLANEIAKESDKAQQLELQKQLISLNEQQQLSMQQLNAQEQARLDALRQQQIQQAKLQATQASTKVVKSSSTTSSTKSSITSTTTTPTTPKTTTTTTPKTPVKTKAS